MEGSGSVGDGVGSVDDFTALVDEAKLRGTVQVEVTDAASTVARSAVVDGEFGSG